MEKHASDEARILQRDPVLVSVVDGVCSKFDRLIEKNVNEIELEILIDGTGISHETEGVDARLKCVSEMKLMRRNMDRVFAHVANGDMQWTELEFKSLYSVNVLIDLFNDFHELCELTRKDHSELAWILRELKLKFRLSLQKGYQAVFMHEAK
jgi:hypothetical protein